MKEKSATDLLLRPVFDDFEERLKVHSFKPHQRL
jgi:hypothetical protein